MAAMPDAFLLETSGYATFSSIGPPSESEDGQAAIVDKKTWQEDTVRCSLCHSRFGDVLNRRHHCRTCGKCVCHDCSPNSLQIMGKMERVCNPCVLNGAGALELLPALHHLREELCSFNGGTPDFASLPPAKHPAQAVAECVVAVEPLRKTLLPQGDERCQNTVAAEAETLLPQNWGVTKPRQHPFVTLGNAYLSQELSQEKRSRQELEGKLGELAEGLCQLDRMLKGLKGNMPESGSDSDDAKAAVAHASEEINSQPARNLKKCERVLASCTLSAGVWLHHQKSVDGTRSDSPVPVLSRMLGERTSTVSTVSHSASSASFSSDDSGIL